MLKSSSIARVGIPPKVVDDSTFLIVEAKLAFIQLRQAFTKAFISHYFDSKYYIRIKTDASGYIIGGNLSQLTVESD